MINRDPKRYRLLPGTDLLESRKLLNAHMPHHPAVHVSAISSHGSRQISGAVSGTALYVQYSPNSANPILGGDTYTATGSANRRGASYSGQDLASSSLINSSDYHDVYSGGSSTLTLSNGSTVAISYVGNGRSTTAGTNYKASFTGNGISTSGSNIGHVYKFNAKVVGNGADGTVTIKFTLKG